MNDESKLQIRKIGDDSPLSFSSGRSNLVARGRRDATSLVFGRLSALRRKAEAGDREYQFELGAALREGYLPPEDPPESPPFVLSSDTDAERELKMTLREQHAEWVESNRRLNSFGKDPVQAMVWLRKAADQKHLCALDQLGEMYLEGDVVDRNPAEALRCFSVASDDDLNHGEWDPDIFGKMWLRAAYLGHAKSQYLYGCTDALHCGSIEAYVWLSLAIASGQLEGVTKLSANQVLRRIVAKMSADQVARAKIRECELLAKIPFIGKHSDFENETRRDPVNLSMALKESLERVASKVKS